MEPATGSLERASPSPSSSSGLFRRRLGSGNGFGFGNAAFAAAAQLACVLAVLFCVTSVTSIRSRCHASKATSDCGEAKAMNTNDAERAAPISDSAWVKLLPSTALFSPSAYAAPLSHGFRRIYNLNGPRFKIFLGQICNVRI